LLGGEADADGTGAAGIQAIARELCCVGISISTPRMNRIT
jgi:hypothetical protein